MEEGIRLKAWQDGRPSTDMPVSAGLIGGVTGLNLYERIIRPVSDGMEYGCKGGKRVDARVDSLFDWLRSYPPEKVRLALAPRVTSPLILRDISYVRPDYFPRKALLEREASIAECADFGQFRKGYLLDTCLFRPDPLMRPNVGDAVSAFAALESGNVSAQYATMLAERQGAFFRKEIELMVVDLLPDLGTLRAAGNSLLACFEKLDWDPVTLDAAREVSLKVARVGVPRYLRDAKRREDGILALDRAIEGSKR